RHVTGVQTCALPISSAAPPSEPELPQAARAPAAARPVVPARNARRFRGWLPFMSNLLVRARSRRTDETRESVFANVQWRASHVKSPRCGAGRGGGMNNGRMDKGGPRLRDVAEAAGVSGEIGRASCREGE